MAAPGPVVAQERSKAQQVDLPAMLRTAYSLRRRGQFRAAAAAYEQILEKLGKDQKAVKRVLAREAAELFVVMGKPEKAVKSASKQRGMSNYRLLAQGIYDGLQNPAPLAIKEAREAAARAPSM